ncbi:hypothetical protein [Cytobacillus firmus]|uniref:hypothetical protein n=1 Tax=Cytobacillus firmus TaxID=1399 RepID=UPI003001F07B
MLGWKIGQVRTLDLGLSRLKFGLSISDLGILSRKKVRIRTLWGGFSQAESEESRGWDSASKKSVF